MSKMSPIIFVFLLSLAVQAHTAPLAAEDFVPPIQAKTPEARQTAQSVLKPEAVKEDNGVDGKPVVSAASAQDGINAAIKRIPVSGGCEQFKFPSGFGWVATGSEIYTAYPNPVTTLSAQRLAYQKAYLVAKRNLAQTLFGLSTTGSNQLAQDIKTVLTGTEALANTNELLSENITELISGLLRGYVVYSVHDEQKEGHGVVTVSIVTTPKTMGKIGRVDVASLTAASVEEGLNTVLAEASSGLIPPVGGKVINVPQTGELAFVGFGTAVVVGNENQAVQAKLELDAQKIAAMRARNALCGIILGDEIMAKTSLDSTTQSMSAQFEELQKDDPVNERKNEKRIRKLEAQKTDFLTTQVSKEEIASLKRGVLPPGVSIKTFFSENKTLVESIAIYIPSVTHNASQSARDMRRSGIAPNGTQNNVNGQGANMPSRGASGQVSNASDL